MEDAPASLGLGVDTNGAGTTAGVLRAGQFLTVGAQLVRMVSTVLKAVASATGVGADAAETCSWTWPSESSLAKPAMTAEPVLKATRANE